MEDGLLSLKWNNHKKTFTKAISVYRDAALYSDVTLACGGQFFNVHKIILSSCSEYFQDIFTITECKKPVIILKDIRPEDVEYLLQYIYMGEVEVKQSELTDLIKAAECLKIKGLATPDDETEEDIPKKRKRKKHPSGDRPDSPKQLKSSQCNAPDDISVNKENNPNTSHMNELKEIIKVEPDCMDIIEDTKTKYEFDKIEKSGNHSDDNSMQHFESYEEKVEALHEDEFNTDNLELNNAPIEYVPEFGSMAGPSGISEDSAINNSNLDDSMAGQESMRRKAVSYSRDMIGRHKVYSCTKCSFVTPVKTNFIVHFRKHTGEKPFKCPYCNYSSATKQNVQKHLPVHMAQNRNSF